MDYLGLLIIAATFLAWSLVSGRLEGTPITGPLFFAAAGFLASDAVTGLVPLQISNRGLHLVAEITLVLVLFSDAALIDLKQLRRDHNLPARMLALGLPLTILLGTLAGLWLFPDIGLWGAALLAAILAPTDAALGQAVVSDKAVPVRIRLALNVESGLNDGIALPLVLIFAVLAGAADSDYDTSGWLAFGASQVIFGPLAGLLVGWLGARLVMLSDARGWLSESTEGIMAIALPFVALTLAELVHGNGFIAAFVAGLAFGNTLGKRCEYLYAFGETEGSMLVLATFGAFGCAMLPMAMEHISPASALYAVMALTLVRILPVWLALSGTGVNPLTRLFLGWFGPRGLASVLFVLLILEESTLSANTLIETTVIVTVAFSVLLHGLSAGPGAAAYARRAAAMGTCPENESVPEMPFEPPLAGVGAVRIAGQ